MEGNAKIIKLIARDENLHLSGTQFILNKLASGEDDPEFKEIAFECYDISYQMFINASEQEKEWAHYLFKDGSTIGMNAKMLCQYIEYITNLRASGLGFPYPYPESLTNPFPWSHAWTSSDNVQVAPQEVEISSYLIGQVDTTVDTGSIESFEL